MKLLLSSALIAGGLMLTGTANAADANALCLSIIEKDGISSDVATKACGCMASSIGDNADLLAQLQASDAAATKEERDAVYSDELKVITESCGPWT